MQTCSLIKCLDVRESYRTGSPTTYLFLNVKVFARKLVRVSTSIPEKNVENEARVVTSIHQSGGHQNIVSVLDYGWLKGQYKVYFIDMELANCTLSDYLDYQRGEKTQIIELDEGHLLSPVFVRKGSLYTQRVQNMWAIGIHIASGLEFLHRHKHVHRDLKPKNGKCPRILRP